MTKVNVTRLLARLTKPLRQRLSGPRPSSIPNDLPFWSAYDAEVAASHRTEVAKGELKERLARLDNKLLISVIMPIYSSNLEFLGQAIQSVLDQEYPHWELCIVDDGSPTNEAFNLAQTYSVNDPRIRILRTANGGISRATNAAVDISIGDVVAFLDHDDVLSSDALGEVAYVYGSHPEVDLVFSDDDKIDEHGTRYDRQSKRDWNPLTLLSFMYISHLLTVRRALFVEIGGFRSEFDGSQDHDFALRVAPKLRRSVHIPKVLYHWRALPGSTAVSGNEKPASFEASRLAIQEALQGYGIKDATVFRPDFAVKNGLSIHWISSRAVSQPFRLFVFGTTKELKSWNRHSGSIPLNVKVELQSTDIRQAINLACENLDLSSVNIIVGAHLTPPTASQIQDLAMLSKLAGHKTVVVPTVVRNGLVCGGVVDLNRDGKSQIRSLGLPPSRLINHYVGQTLHYGDGFTSDCISGTAAAIIDLQQRLAASGPRVELEKLRVISAPSVNLTSKNSHIRSNNITPTAKEVFSNNQLKSFPARILFVSHNLEYEGAPITLLDIVTALKERGNIIPSVVAPETGPLLSHYKCAGIKIYLNSNLKKSDPSKQELFTKEMKEQKFEVVAFNTITNNIFVEETYSNGTPVVIFQHESESPHHYYDSLSEANRHASYQAFWQAYQVTYVSQATLDDWAPLNRRSNFRLIRNALPPNQIRGPNLDRNQQRLVLNIGDKISILCVGAIGTRKSQMDLVRAVARLPRTIRSVIDVRLVGSSNDKSYIDELMHLIERHNLGETISIDADVDSTAPYYAAADIYVCCSKMESSPRAILEAMEMGLPIVTTPVYGIAELITHRLDGLHFSPGDIKQLARHIRTLVNNPELGKRLGGAAQTRLRTNHDFRRMVDEYERLLLRARLSANITKGL